jgi:hypothetical protein
MTLGLKAKMLNREITVFLSGICMTLGSSSKNSVEKICHHEIWR